MPSDLLTLFATTEASLLRASFTKDFISQDDLLHPHPLLLKNQNPFF